MKRTIPFALALAFFGCRAAPHTRPVILDPHEGDQIWFSPESRDRLGSGGELQIYVDAETFPRARASFAKFNLGAGGELPVHRHDKTEEIAYILGGEGSVVVIDETGARVEVPISAGHVWYNPPGVWHGVKNTGTEPLSMVFATIPNEKEGLLSFFRRIGVAPGSEGTRLTPEEFERIGREHDLILRDSVTGHP